MNLVTLVGRTTKDIELQKTPSGISFCRFSVAVNRDYKNQDGKTEADFPNVIAWREQAENTAKYVRKGDRVGIVGKLQTRSYEDKNGVKRYDTDVIADRVEFMQDKRGEGQSGNSAPPPPKKAEHTAMGDLEPADDELPF